MSKRPLGREIGVVWKLHLHTKDSEDLAASLERAGYPSDNEGLADWVMNNIKPASAKAQAQGPQKEPPPDPDLAAMVMKYIRENPEVAARLRAGAGVLGKNMPLILKTLLKRKL